MKPRLFKWITYKDGKKDKTYECSVIRTSETQVILSVSLGWVKIGSVQLDIILVEDEPFDYNDQVMIENEVEKIINRS